MFIRGLKNTQQHKDYWTQRKIDWVSHYWNPDHPHRDFIIEILKTSPPGSVCEIGCGAGANLYRIKKEFTNCKIAGCDLNQDAIDTANKLFFDANLPKAGTPDYSQHPKMKELKGFLPDSFVKLPNLQDIEFKVGGIEVIPFHGESYDLILTDACLLYVGPDKIFRALREIRRIGYKNMMFVELHHKSWFKRMALRLTRGYFAYDYEKLLKENYFKSVKITKIPPEIWPNEPWKTFGVIITCGR